MLPDAPCVITLSGDFDVYTTPQFEVDLKRSDNARDVVIDFARVGYVDSTAISALVRMESRRAAAGLPAVHFASVSPELQRVFQMSALGDVWPYYEDVERAIASFLT
jgi:anti-anti-sigma factor